MSEYDNRYNLYKPVLDAATSCSDLMERMQIAFGPRDQPYEPFPIVFTSDNCVSQDTVDAKEPRFPNNGASLAAMESGNPRMSDQFLSTFKTSVVFVPFNQQTTLETENQVKRILPGPQLLHSSNDEALLTYTRIHTQTYLHPWNDYLKDICFGTVESFGRNKISSLDMDCDDFMQKIYCAVGGTNYTKNVACACFKEQDELAVQYPNLTVPVICFGPKCAHGGYQTTYMRNDNCSPAVCGQLISQQAGKIYDTGTTNIHCDSDYYLVRPTPTPTPGSGGDSPGTVAAKKKHLTTTQAIMIGVGMILFVGLLAGLLIAFREKVFPKK